MDLIIYALNLLEASKISLNSKKFLVMISINSVLLAISYLICEFYLKVLGWPAARIGSHHKWYETDWTMFNVIPVGAQMDRFLVVGHRNITDIIIHNYSRSAVGPQRDSYDVIYVIIMSDRVNYYLTGNTGWIFKCKFDTSELRRRNVIDEMRLGYWGHGGNGAPLDFCTLSIAT